MSNQRDPAIDRTSEVSDWDRDQDLFLARSRAAIIRAQETGTGMSPSQLLRRLDDRLDAARQLLAKRSPRR